MKTTHFKRLVLAFLATLVCALSGCSNREPPSSSTGTLQLPLQHEAGGNTYRLRDAVFDIVGPETQTVDAEDHVETEIVSLSLTGGVYLIELRDGWRLERRVPDGWQDVEAGLLSENPSSVEIRPGETTRWDLRLWAEGDGPLTPRSGGLEIGLAVEIRCDPFEPNRCPLEQSACHPVADGIAACRTRGPRPVGDRCGDAGVPGQCLPGAVCDQATGVPTCLALCDLSAEDACDQGTCVPSPSYAGFGVCVSDGVAANSVEASLEASSGGRVEHPDGLTLTFPSDSLPEDAQVHISNVGRLTPTWDQGMRAVTDRFVISVMGVADCKVADLVLSLPEAGRGGDAAADLRRSLVLSTVGPTAEDGIALHALGVSPGEAGEGPTGTVDFCQLAGLIDGFSILSMVVEVQFIPELDFSAAPTIVRVPYYWQDNLPWCVPTSLAMTMNQFEELEGIVSNYQLAGADNQASDEGNSYVSILKSLGVDEDVYSYLKWDADLIPSAPFTNYLKYFLSGNFPSVTRGLALSSTTTSHAFVGVGANNTHVWVHDSSGAFAGEAGVAVQLTWAEFKNIAMDDTSSTELRTLLIGKPLRPANERTGSLVLDEGTNGSLRYTVGGITKSSWRWEGSSWDNGYIWDDIDGDLPQDGVYGNRFPRDDDPAVLPGHFPYKVRIANVTGTPRTYEVWAFLGTNLNPAMESYVQNVVVPPYSWNAVQVTGLFQDFVINSDGEYRVQFELWESGNWVDFKRIGFAVGDGPLAIP